MTQVSRLESTTATATTTARATEAAATSAGATESLVLLLERLRGRSTSRRFRHGQADDDFHALLGALTSYLGSRAIAIAGSDAKDAELASLSVPERCEGR